MARLLALLTAALLAACSAQQGDRAAPVAQAGRVRDFADLLTPVQEARLAARLDEAQRRYGPEVGIVTVRSLEGRPIAEFANDYANQWGLGDAERRDGLIILVAPNERQVRIGTASGIEGAYSDAWAQDVIDGVMLEHFRQHHWNRGLAAGLDLIIGHMKQHPTRPANDNAPAAESNAA